MEVVDAICNPGKQDFRVTITWIQGLLEEAAMWAVAKPSLVVHSLKSFEKCEEIEATGQGYNGSC